MAPKQTRARKGEIKSTGYERLLLMHLVMLFITHTALSARVHTDTFSVSGCQHDLDFHYPYASFFGTYWRPSQSPFRPLNVCIVKKRFHTQSCD